MAATDSDENGCIGYHGFQLGKQRLLGLQSFDDGFNHQFGRGEIGNAGGQLEAAIGILDAAGGHLALFDQTRDAAQHILARPFERGGVQIIENDFQARGKPGLRNARAHGPCAHNAHDPNICH